MTIPSWQRFVGICVYMLPWSDAIPFGRILFVQFPVLQWLAMPAIPVLAVERGIPFGSLLLFFTLFLAVVRNPKAPYFIRFNTLQALLIDIALIVTGYAFQIILQPLQNNLVLRTFSSTVFISILAIVIFTSIECIKGKEADLPGISEAVRVQL